MTPLTKETAEATNQAAESAAPRTVASAPNPARLHSEAVSLEIPIKVHGSRVTEVVLGTTPHTEPFEEQSTTMIVFAQGGVLKMSTPVTSGQMMVLTNLKTRQDVICRVLKVRNNPNLQSYVEIEFTHPQPGYWGVFFPSDDSEQAPRPAASVQPVNSESRIKAETSPESSRPFAGPPNMPSAVPARPPVASVPPSPSAANPAPASYVAPLPQPGSAFISIGSQEEVQVAASSTLSKNAKLLESVKENRGASAPKKNPAEAANISTAPSAPVFAGASVVELSAQSAIELERQLQPIAEAPAANSTRAFGESGASDTPATSREMFGSTLGVSAAGNLAETTGPRRNWLLIAACAAVAVVLVIGAVTYFSSAPAGKSGGSSNAVVPPAPVVETSQNSAQSAAGQTPYSIPAPSANAAPNGSRSADNANAARASHAVVTDHVDESPVQAPSSVTPKRMARSLNAHPVAAKRTGMNQAEAPTLDAGLASPSANTSLAAVVGASNTLPPPPPSAVSLGGGVVKNPKLISSAPPVYPRAAMQAMVDGDVVIHAVIDKNGNVTEATVISGPMMLQNSALDAVRRWKYAPSTLNGEPVSADTTVTVKFRR